MPGDTESRAQNAAKKAAGRLRDKMGIGPPKRCPKCGRSGVKMEAAHDTYLGKNRTKTHFLCASCHRKQDMGVRRPGAPANKRARGKSAEGKDWKGGGPLAQRRR